MSKGNTMPKKLEVRATINSTSANISTVQVLVTQHSNTFYTATLSQDVPYRQIRNDG
jgi:hypothetical protein